MTAGRAIVFFLPRDHFAMTEQADVTELMARIKELEQRAQDDEERLVEQQKQLSDWQAHRRRKLYGLNDVHHARKRLEDLRQVHARFCRKHAGGKSVPRTLPARTKLLTFIDDTLTRFDTEFATYLEALHEVDEEEGEKPTSPPRKKAKRAKKTKAVEA